MRFTKGKLSVGEKTGRRKSNEIQVMLSPQVGIGRTLTNDARGRSGPELRRYLLFLKRSQGPRFIFPYMPLFLYFLLLTVIF